jgi:uncharacterized protein
LEKYDKMKLIGRVAEQQQFDEIMANTNASFVALYGRRRVGKTFLIKEYFNHDFTFYATGLANANTTMQLFTFNNALQEYFNTTTTILHNWLEAFMLLKKCLQQSKKSKTIFLDELPWFDTAKSDFITGLEWFWNSWASTQKKLKLIVCGSAAAWMTAKLLNNTGGLHNRLTHHLKISPFTLLETEEFLQQKNIVLSRYQIVKLYMALGGIPYYLDQVRKGESDVQAIERLCFSPSGILKTEFNFIFTSLFKDASKHELIVKKIYELGRQATRDNIAKETKIESSGDFSKKLMELEESGFIKSYVPFGLQKSKKIYILADYFSLFHLKFIAPNNKYDKGMWINRIADTSITTWQGLSFEFVCFDHLQAIKKALGIEGIQSVASPWYYKGIGNKSGAQIDLLIDRKDNVINLCEIKFSNNPYIITKKYDEEMRKKLNTFYTETKTRKAIFPTMITTFGLHKNEYTTSFVQSDITIDKLFV